MRVSIFSDADGATVADVLADPDLGLLADWQGQPLSLVRMASILRSGDIEVQVVQIAAGGHFVMHSSPQVAFCQVVRGRGQLGLPDGTSIPYSGPELYVFLPNSLHDWHDISEDTLLSVCLVATKTPNPSPQ
ncbi:MAG TPA: hypothetical protein VMP67_06305 [Candidatus Limnocylindria bacterium]|nr:hypothetical protein [Candidatus Limnocylindria bacterium]